MKPIMLSLIGLYNYNPDVLQGLQIPEEWENMDTDELHFKILEECAELEVLYPDPDYMEESITRWAASRMYTWGKIYFALTADYNPLWNKDGTVTETSIHGARTETRNYGAKSATNSYGQKQDTHAYGARSVTNSIGARSGEQVETVSAFNSSSYEPSKKVNNSSLAATDGSLELAHTDTITEGQHSDTLSEQARIDTVGNASFTDTVTRRETGNIGVTTSQEMLEAEMKLRAAYDMYDIIAMEFKRKFCLLVY